VSYQYSGFTHTLILKVKVRFNYPRMYGRNQDYTDSLVWYHRFALFRSCAFFSSLSNVIHCHTFRFFPTSFVRIISIYIVSIHFVTSEIEYTSYVSGPLTFSPTLSPWEWGCEPHLQSMCSGYFRHVVFLFP
jgi:hypothetical protein